MAADEERRKAANESMNACDDEKSCCFVGWPAKQTKCGHNSCSVIKMCFVMKQVSKMRRKKKIERRNYDEPHPEIARKQDAQVSRKKNARPKQQRVVEGEQNVSIFLHFNRSSDSKTQILRHLHQQRAAIVDFD